MQETIMMKFICSIIITIINTSSQKIFNRLSTILFVQVMPIILAFSNINLVNTNGYEQKIKTFTIIIQ